MPATLLTLRTPWPRALWLSLSGFGAAAVAVWERRRAAAQFAEELPALDDRTLRDVGLPDWVRHDVAERREARTVERVAAGMPADWTR